MAQGSAIRQSNLQHRRWLGLAVGAGLGAVALLINQFPVPLFANAQLMLGGALVMLAVSRLGLVPALLCAVIATVGIYQYWQHPLAFAVFGLEAGVVWWFRHRGSFLLYADLFYWICIGMPLVYIALIVLEAQSQSLAFIVLKQGFNGLLYTAMAALMLVLVPSHWWKGIRQQPILQRGFRDKLTYAVVVLLALSSMVGMVFYSAHLMNTQQELLYKRLQDDGNRIANNAHQFLGRYVSAVAVTGQRFSSEPQQQQQRLAELHQQYPGWLTMLVADRKGDIVAASPLRQQHAVLGLNVAHRDYFSEVILDPQPYVSGVFQGRGFGDDIIAAISAPWYDHAGEVAGVIEGSLDLRKLAQVLDSGSHQRFVITDGQKNVVVASEGFGIKPLMALSGKVQRQVGEGLKITRLSLPRQFQNEREVYELDFALGHGWTLHMMSPYQPAVVRAETQFMVGIGLLALGALAAVMLVRRVSRLLTAPLELLAKQIAQPYHPERPSVSLPKGAAQEIFLLQREIEAQRQSIYAHHEKLEQQVAERTEELAQANVQLKKLALRDGLTGAYNRRYFDNNFESYRQHSMRSGQPLLLAMVDIDHFKSINDCFGHLVGDDCLTALVQRMQQVFSRENDLVARYGGEEFVLLVPYTSARSARQLLNKLRTSVAEQPLTTTSQGQPISITISIGAVYAPAELSKDSCLWLEEADRALYEAKQAGRNRVRLRNRVNQVAPALDNSADDSKSRS